MFTSGIHVDRIYFQGWEEKEEDRSGREVDSVQRCQGVKPITKTKAQVIFKG